MDIMKRKFLHPLALIASLTACVDTSLYGKPFGKQVDSADDNDTEHNRSWGVTVGELVISSLVAVRGVIFYDERGSVIRIQSGIDPRGNQKSAYPGGERGVPKKIRVTWRVGKFEMSPDGTGWVGGKIVGDYTVSVADRIPDETLEYVRSHNTSLRLKLRVYEDGLLVGWDIETRPGFDPKKPDVYAPPVYLKVGGDFKEAYIRHGKVIEKGWYIDSQGQRIETDW